MKNNKFKVAVMFGGKSPEHEVSIITGLQAFENIDREKFDPFVLYISKQGEWFIGEVLERVETYRNLDNISQKAIQVIPFMSTERKGVVLLKGKRTPFLFFRKTPITTIDVVFPAFHGGSGENGGVAGLFEVMDIPCVGPGITGSVLGMDKVVMKQLFEQGHVPLTKWLWIYRNVWEKDRTEILKKIEKQLKFPLFVKPANGGSSIGTTKAHKAKELEHAIEVAALFDQKVIVEEGFENAREINISVLGNAGSELRLSVCEEVFASGEVLTFEDKYIGDSRTGTSKGMSQTKRQIPANIPKEIEKKIQDTAKLVFEILNVSGVSRIDFLYREKTAEIIVLEINTIPGSLSFYLWEASGMKFVDLTSRLIDLSFERYEETKKSTTTFSSNILETFNSGAKSKA